MFWSQKKYLPLLNNKSWKIQHGFFIFRWGGTPFPPQKKKNYKKSVKMTKICPDPPSQVWNFASFFWLRTSPIYITGSSYSGSPFLQHVGISYPLTFRATVLWHVATPITWLSGPLFYGMWHLLQTSPDLMEDLVNDLIPHHFHDCVKMPHAIEKGPWASL